VATATTSAAAAIPAAAGAILSAGALVGLALSTTGFLGWHESALRRAVAARLGLGLDRGARAAVLVLAIVPLAGYILSRSTGLPGATDDVGDWANPLGLATLAVDAALIALALPRPRSPGAARREPLPGSA